MFLCRCPGIFGTSLKVEATDIADADAVGIVPFAMSTRSFDGSPSVNRPVQVHNVMIADAGEAALAVPAVDVVHRHRHALWRGGAVHDDLIYASHSDFRYGSVFSMRQTSC